MAVESGLTENKVVVFRVGKQEYAVPITAVREVDPWTEPTPVPDAPPLVEGVINLRGEVIPIIDLGRLFKVARTTSGAEAKIMVMEVADQQAGFVVDEVTEVHTVSDGAVSPPSPIFRGSAAGLNPTPIVSGILKMGDSRLVVLVDAGRILEEARLTGALSS